MYGVCISRFLRVLWLTCYAAHAGCYLPGLRLIGGYYAATGMMGGMGMGGMGGMGMGGMGMMGGGMGMRGGMGGGGMRGMQQGQGMQGMQGQPQQQEAPKVPPRESFIQVRTTSVL
jgi:hypothetical protein